MNHTIEINDTHVPLPKAFVKLGKKVYMEKYVDRGELRFAPAYEFSHMQEGRDGVADRYEGSLFYPISKLYIAPLLSDDENGVVYGKPVKLADTAIQRITTPTIQRIPFHCLYCYPNPAMNAIIRLDNYDQVVQEFPDYDTAVIIYNPLEFLHKLESKFEIYANHVKYTDRTPLEDELPNDIHCLYYKREEYKEQNEFRIALPKIRIDKPEIYEVGSLSDIAYFVPLKYLKYGIIIADNNDDYQLLKKRCEDLGFGVGNHTEHEDAEKNVVDSIK